MALKIPSNRLLLRLLIIDRTGLRKMRRLVDPATGKEVILIPMAHLEKARYFEEIKYHLGCLKEDGYVVFYEGLSMPAMDGGWSNDILLRKFRRVMGFFLTGYKNSSNKSIPRSIRDNNYTEQTRENLGLVTERDLHVDMTLSQLIAAYEKERGEIVLTDYDMHTDLLDEYNPDDEHPGGSGGSSESNGSGGHDMQYMIRTLRDRHIVNEVLGSHYRRIVLLYGKLHIRSIARLLIGKGFRKYKMQN